VALRSGAALAPYAGIIGGRGDPWDLNRLAFHPGLLDLAERFLGSGDLRLCDAELWAKYSSERVRRGAASQQRRQMMAHPVHSPLNADAAFALPGPREVQPKGLLGRRQGRVLLLEV